MFCLALIPGVNAVASDPVNGGPPGAVGKAACLESRRSRVRPTLWQSGFRETNVSSPLTREDLILWGDSVTQLFKWVKHPVK